MASLLSRQRRSGAADALKDAFLKIVRTEGTPALWRGLTPTLYAMSPHRNHAASATRHAQIHAHTTHTKTLHMHMYIHMHIHAPPATNHFPRMYPVLAPTFVLLCHAYPAFLASSMSCLPCVACTFKTSQPTQRAPPYGRVMAVPATVVYFTSYDRLRDAMGADR